MSIHLRHFKFNTLKLVQLRSRPCATWAETEGRRIDNVNNCQLLTEEGWHGSSKKKYAPRHGSEEDACNVNFPVNVGTCSSDNIYINTSVNLAYSRN